MRSPSYLAAFRRANEAHHTRSHSRIKETLWVMALMLLSGLPLAHADQVDQDLAHRSTRIHWPASPNPTHADVFSHNDIIIRASCDTVWNHLIDAIHWPSWYPNSQDVRILTGSPNLGPHTRFSWNTFGVHIDSTIHEFVPPSRLGWFGRGPDVRAYHTWLLEPQGTACHVTTEEATQGEAAAAGRRLHPSDLHDGHALWLQRLKALSEASSP